MRTRLIGGLVVLSAALALLPAAGSSGLVPGGDPTDATEAPPGTMVAAPPTPMTPASSSPASPASSSPAAVESAPVESLAAPARGSATQVGPTLPAPLPEVVPPELQVPADSGHGRRVVYSIAAQRVWAIEADGTVARTHRVSGRVGSPAIGTYAVWSRSATTCAVGNFAVCWRYMIRFALGPNGGNIGFHEIPLKFGAPVQTDAQLGQPLSGGCVRQSTADAEWMWEWATLGTAVVVL